jgi:hypothetical protein
MFAIGVRCTSFSAAGTAKFNGEAGTFNNFQRKNPVTLYEVPPSPLSTITYRKLILRIPSIRLIAIALLWDSMLHRHIIRQF